MALKIRTFGDPVLREKGGELEAVDAEVRALVKEMSETLSESPGRVGLAAPQVGVLKKLFVYDLGYGPRCLINPVILEGEGEDSREEGCLSFPGIYVTIPRYQKVRASCLTPSGHRVLIEADGFTARVFQHECDHLDGVLIIDRCDTDERKRALDEYRDIELRKTVPDA